MYYLFGVLLIVSCNSQKGTNQEYDSIYGKDSVVKQVEEKIVPIGSGIITSVADGYDVKLVTLWDAAGSDRRAISQLKEGDQVNILEDEDPYYYIESLKTQSKGYCMKGYIKSIKWYKRNL